MELCPETERSPNIPSNNWSIIIRLTPVWFGTLQVGDKQQGRGDIDGYFADVPIIYCNLDSCNNVAKCIYVMQ